MQEMSKIIANEENKDNHRKWGKFRQIIENEEHEENHEEWRIQKIIQNEGNDKNQTKLEKS